MKWTSPERFMVIDENSEPLASEYTVETWRSELILRILFKPSLELPSVT